MTSSTLSPRPLFITLIALIFSAHVLFVAIFIVYVTFASGETLFNYKGEIAKIGDHRLEILSVLIAYWPVAFAISYGFWGRKKWSQHIIPAIHLAALAANLFLERARPELLFVILYVALVFWYFYGKGSVRAYYGVA